LIPFNFSASREERGGASMLNIFECIFLVACVMFLITFYFILSHMDNILDHVYILYFDFWHVAYFFIGENLSKFKNKKNVFWRFSIVRSEGKQKKSENQPDFYIWFSMCSQKIYKDD